MTEHDDRAIRAAFGGQREEYSRQAPAFDRVREPGGRRRQSRRMAPLATLATALLGALALGYALHKRAQSRLETPWPVDLTRTEWIGPTDFLLDTPKSDSLTTMPLPSSDSIRSPL